MDTEDIKNMTTAYLQVLAEAKKKKDGMHKMPDGSMMKDDDPHMKEKKKLDPVDKNALKATMTIVKMVTSTMMVIQMRQTNIYIIAVRLLKSL